jgi:Ribbon-helix-helix protein, copG family
MTRVTLELDEETLARVESIARARQTSVEDLLRRQAEDIARLAPIQIHNPSHRKILSALKRGPDDYSSPRKEAHDREKARAEAYAASRRRLLELIDRTDGDLGLQAWDRRRLYEC